MKKFRPYKAGFIVLYVLALLSVSDAVHTIVRELTGTANEYMQSFSLFSYLIAALAIVYVKIYAVTRIEVGPQSMRIVNPVYIRPAAGAKRAMFIYRQGDLDLHLVDKKFNLSDLEKYGYIEDLGYAQLDKTTAGPNNKLFPVHEIALVMKDGKRYHMHGGYYSAKQLKAIVEEIKSATGIAPEGKLAEI